MKYFENVQPTAFLNRLGMVPKDTLLAKGFFVHVVLKGKTDILKYNCYLPLRRECGIARMNLNSRTDCIILTMLERMRLT